MQKEKIYILTDAFPYGSSEKTFILPEIEVLKKVYDIVLISGASSKIAAQKELISELDDNIKVFRFCPEENGKFSYYKYFLLFWTKKDCLAEVKNIIGTRKKVLLRVWKSMHFYARAESRYRWIRNNNIIDPKGGIYYSYWYYDKVLTMTMHRDKYPELKAIARAHRYDLFDEAVKKTLRQPFKRIMDSGIDQIMFVSDYNLNYYIEKMGINYSEKYSVQRIGAPEAKRFPEIIDRKKTFRIVSCSNIIKVKRVPLIVDALSRIEDIRIDWIHFGSGTDAKEVEEYTKNSLHNRKNICFSFKGYMPRSKIYEYYTLNFVHCFINVSESEGSPVSIQEALAFGMPIIGTDVGGVSEMIDGNGYLLTANPSAEEVADSIRRIYSMSEMEYNAMRERSFTIWQNDYDLNKNMSNLLDIFKQV